jgi:GTPase SAR1 family protein
MTSTLPFAISKKRDRIQNKFLCRVETEVEKRLQQSLHNRIYIVLEKQENSEQVQFPSEIDIKTRKQLSSRLAKDTPIEQVFDRSDIAGRLLILGAPGSGKTTMLLKLAERLVIRAKANPQLPIPILLNLSSWKDDNQSIKQWIISSLQFKYNIRQNIAKQWIEQGAILPLLDGLDELAEARQEKCVEKLNHFLHPDTCLGSVVVSSRIQEYQCYTTNLALNGSITLQPLTTEQVQDYVLKTEGKALWNNIKLGSGLLNLIRTPLFLNIIILSHEEISFGRWHQFESLEEKSNHLFEAYIRQMLKRRYSVKKKPYKDEDTIRWLAWLSKQLTRENQTDFSINTIQPIWLDSPLKRISYGIIFGLIYGSIFGLIHGLVVGFNSQLFGLLIVRLIQGSMFGLIFGLIYGLIVELIFGLISKLIYGVIFGLVVGLTVGVIVGSIPWLLVVGLIFGLIVGLDEELIVRLKRGLNIGLMAGLIFGLIFKLVGGLMVGLLVGLIFGLIFGLINLKYESRNTQRQGIWCFEHFSLRLVLYWSKNIPWNYSKFLNYGTERLFLKRMENRYQFIHDLLNKHFSNQY